MTHWILGDNRQHIEVDLYTWEQWFEQVDNRIVAQTDTEKGNVSTVFLGIDHSFRLGRPPILYETMVFGGALDQEQERYATWDAAEKGHAIMVARVKDKEDVQ